MAMMSKVVAQWAQAEFSVYSYQCNLLTKGHDRILLGEGLIAVADGATPLLDKWPDSGRFAENAIACLASTALVERDATEMWRRSIRATAQIDPSFKAPAVSCAIAFARESNGSIEFSTLGDCIAMVKTMDGSVTVLTDLDILARDLAAADLRDVSDTVRQLLANRVEMNTAASYWIFSDNQEAAEHIKVATVAVCDIHSFLICSDGMLEMASRLSDSAIDWLVDKFRLDTSRMFLERLSSFFDAKLPKKDDVSVILALKMNY